jgi:16S rRNA processing protein RimM
MANKESADWVAIGRVLKPQGVRGELKVLPLTTYPERFKQLANVQMGASENRIGSPIAVKSCRVNSSFVFLTLSGLNTMEDAEYYRNHLIFVKRDECVKLPADEFFIFDLIGLVAVTPDGVELGKLAEVLEYPANDVYVIEHNAREVLVPAVAEFVKNIDIQAGQIVISPIGGMFEE